MTVLTWEEQLQGAERAGVPIVVIRCPDQAAVLGRVKALFEDRPVMAWNVSEGVRGVNQLGQAAADKINAPGNGQPSQSPLIVSGRASEALNRGVEFMPNKSILCMLNIQMFVEGFDGSQRAVIQSIWNCRDAFKSSERMLLLLCPDMKIPPELINDVITIDVPLSEIKEISKVAALTAGAAGVKPDAENLEGASAALLGLSDFAAEQVAAMCIRKAGFDLAEMWRMKIADINRTPGLRAERGRANSFENLFGLDSLVEFGRALIAGEEPPVIVVLIDEIDKQLGGIAGDSSGTSQDAYGQMLTSMEESEWDGMLLPGFPGGGKTEFSKCLGALAGLFVWMDLGGMKGSYVGSSERMVRAAMSKLRAIGGSRIFFVATCNNVAVIPAPLFRRLTAGTYFVDFPTKEAALAMFKHYMEVNKLKEQPLPDFQNWTGSEIKQACKWARRLRQPLLKSDKRITPVFRSMGEEVDALRKQADGKYLSASEEGWYIAPMNVQKTARKLLKGGGQN